MDGLERRTTIIGAALLIGVVVLGAFLLAGGQTSTILSTVGSSVASGDQSGDGGATDTTADQPNGGAPGEAATPAPNAVEAVAPAPGLLIVRTGTLRLETSTVPGVVDRATAIVTGSGGYVAGSRETTTAADGGASIDFRIPSSSWEPTLAGLRGLGTVLGQEIKTDEVTGKVVDLDARIANLRVTEAALQAIMTKAARIDDILDVQRQLTTTRGEIEQLVGQVKGLRDRASFGSLTVAVTPPAPARPAASAAPGWDPGRDVSEASGKLVRIGQQATTVGIWFGIVGVPILVSLGIGILLLRLAWLALRRTGLIGDREPA